MPDDLGALDAVAQADLVRAGEVSSIELVDAAIARIEKVNPELNAVIHERYEKARAEASGSLPDGPLRGVPMLVKDLDGVTAGDPYHAGTKHLRDIGFVADHDSYLQAKFKQAGMIVLGRTNTPELGLIPSAESEAYGPTRNPWETGHSAGGSSGGSAAAVASRMVAIGHAGDGGGSIRIPASECGLVGLIPSRGRHSLGPEVGEAWSGLVRRHVVTRSVRDSAAVLDAVHGLMPGDPYVAPPVVQPFINEVGSDPGSLRIGLQTQPTDPAFSSHPDCVAAAEHAAALLQSLGHDVSLARHDVFDDLEFQGKLSTHFFNALSVWTAGELDSIARMSGVPVTPEGFEPGTWTIAEMGRSITGLQLHEAQTFFHTFSRRMATWWSDGNDLMLTPTIAEPPPELGQFTSTPDKPLSAIIRATSIVQFTVPFNITGQPAISLPLYWNPSGLPIGVQLVAAYGREDLLLRVASQLEVAAPWADRIPAVSS